MSLPPAPPSSVFRHSIRVYWEDTDAGGVVYYANYLRFFERARTEWLRAAGHQQRALAEAADAMFVVSDARVRYLQPARLDDQLVVSVEPRSQGRASFVLAQQCLKQGQVLCDATIEIACVDRARFRPRRIPTDILACLASAPPTPAD